MVVLVKSLIINIFQIPGRIWEYCLAKEKYNDDGGVSKVTDNKYISDSWSYLGVLFSQLRSIMMIGVSKGLIINIFQIPGRIGSTV